MVIVVAWGNVTIDVPCSYGQQDNYSASLKFKAQRYYWGREVRQNFSKAFNLYLQAAERGDTEAQYIVGGMYFKGIGTERNLKEAFKWLYKAAEKGKSTPQSQKILGQEFLVGRVVPKNYSQSVQWYKMASENGDHDAQNELAFLYYVGRGVEQDFKKAFQWFEKAARGGLVIAQYNVGIMWYTGNGVKQSNLIKAYSWLNLAASNGYSQAEPAAKFIETELDSTDLEIAQKEATALYTQISAEQAKKNN